MLSCSFCGSRPFRRGHILYEFIAIYASQNCLIDTVWTVWYQNQLFGSPFQKQNDVLKMPFVIYETERSIMSIYGYCRISTAKQNIDRQIRNIKAEYPTAHIVREAYTGTSVFRPEWLKLYRGLQSGDTVIFDSVSRMSRNAEEGFALYEDLYKKGIRLVFLKEHHIDTETYQKALSGSISMTGTTVDFILKGINEYLMALAKEQIKLAFEQSEKEVADLHQRTREGLLTAKLNGKQVGRKKGTGFETRKSKEAKRIIRTHCKAFGGTLNDAECIKLTGLARNTYYKYKRQILAEMIAEQNIPKEAIVFCEIPKQF